MEIAILGGTGDIGQGLVLRWGRDAEHDLVVGSRDASRAASVAAEYRERLGERSNDDAHGDASGDAIDDVSHVAIGDATIEGRANDAAIETADVVIPAVPPEHLRETIASVADGLAEDAILVSPAVSLSFEASGVHYDAPPEGSFTAVAAEAAPPSVPVVGTFHTLSAPRLADLDRTLDVDALVVGDDPEARQTIAALVEDVEGLRALDAGPLANAGAVEGLTALQITLGQHNEGLSDLGVRFE